MKYITGILNYNSFLELLESNQIFGENQGLFPLCRAGQARRKDHATLCVASENLRKLKEKSKENSVTE